MIKAENLTKRFDDMIAVDHINAEIKDASVFGLIGTNGAGKSTFLRMMSGVLNPMREASRSMERMYSRGRTSSSGSSTYRMNSIFSAMRLRWR